MVVLGEKMNNKLGIVLLVIGIVLVVGYLFYSSGPVVSAQGSSSLEANPDLVSVYINIEVKNISASDAKNAHDIISNKVMAALKGKGIADEDVQLVNYNIYDDYEWNNGNQVRKGYVVSSQIVVKTSDFDKVREIVDAGIDSGAIISYINFELSPDKQSEYKSQALAEASADARKKAQSTAEGLGKKLGRLVSVQSEEFNYPGPVAYYAKTESATGGIADAAEVRQAALNLAPQDLPITASVRVEYKLRGF